jgi:ketosteroid isomerase-like protein
MATKKKAAPAKKPAAKKKPAAAKKAAPAKKLTTKDAIKAANKTLMGLLAAGDTAGIAKLYTAKAMLLPQGVPGMKGAKNIAGYWAGAVAQGVAGGALKTAEVDELGSTAIESGTYQLKTADGAVCGAGKYVVVWKKEGGAWKLHRDIFNSDT